MSQHLRFSQYVFTWGPGSIIEGPNGPRMILMPDTGLFNPENLKPGDFEISDQRMSEGLLEGARIFRLPSNAELHKTQDYALYRTNPFPEWKLCHNISKHKFNRSPDSSVIFHGDTCPVCHSRAREHMEPVRFVLACHHGHLGDVDWYHVIHGNDSSCSHTEWFIFSGAGGSLSQINIICPGCGKRRNFAEIYGQDWNCSGRYPEREPHRNGKTSGSGCSERAKIIQRQASNLRIPEVKVLFTIPPRHTRLHTLLQRESIRSAIIIREPGNKNELEEYLQRLVENNLVPEDVVKEILEYEWEEIKRAFDNLKQPIGKNYSDLLREEFYAFINGANEGIPPLGGPVPASSVLVEIDPNKIRSISPKDGRSFRIVPVSRLRTVAVQKGYRREVDTENPAVTVDISFRDISSMGAAWLPGVEFLGEGIFIMFEEDNGWHPPLKGKSAENWEIARKDHIKYYRNYLFRDYNTCEELHPVFVWWHTFSHLLIRAISYESGYSSASIRERIYIEQGRDKTRGGIILYTTQPGSEGTLGGLIALIPQFERILYRAFEFLDNCSGDPLCYENKFNPGGYSGAACYACLFLSETSCEHRNMWLDRSVLKDNLPWDG